MNATCASKRLLLQGGQQCWALWAFLAACPCALLSSILYVDCMFINWANKDACLLLQLKRSITYPIPTHIKLCC